MHRWHFKSIPPRKNDREGYNELSPSPPPRPFLFLDHVSLLAPHTTFESRASERTDRHIRRPPRLHPIQQLHSSNVLLQLILPFERARRRSNVAVDHMFKSAPAAVSSATAPVATYAAACSPPSARARSHVPSPSRFPS